MWSCLLIVILTRGVQANWRILPVHGVCMLGKRVWHGCPARRRMDANKRMKPILSSEHSDHKGFARCSFP